LDTGIDGIGYVAIGITVAQHEALNLHRILASMFGAQAHAVAAVLYQQLCGDTAVKQGAIDVR